MRSAGNETTALAVDFEAERVLTACLAFQCGRKRSIRKADDLRLLIAEALLPLDPVAPDCAKAKQRKRYRRHGDE